MDNKELAENRQKLIIAEIQENIALAIERMRSAFNLALIEANRLEYHAGLLETDSNGAKWHPSSEIPNDDALYIVRTKTGSVFVSSPVSGKWFDNIVEWMELPK